MDWRRLLPLMVLFLNAWIAIGFMPRELVGPVSLVLFASLTVVAILGGLTVKRQPKEGEQNVLAIGLILILVAAIGLSVAARWGPQRFEDSRMLWFLFLVWAVVSGYTAGRFWSVPRSAHAAEQEKKETPPTPGLDYGGRGSGKGRGPT